MMTASDALMLPVLSISLDQVQARYGECVSTAPLHAHTVTLHNNHCHDPRQFYQQQQQISQVKTADQTDQAYRSLAASDVNNAGRFAHVTKETTCWLRYDSMTCLRYVTQSAKHGKCECDFCGYCLGPYTSDKFLLVEPSPTSRDGLFFILSVQREV